MKRPFVKHLLSALLLCGLAVSIPTLAASAEESATGGSLPAGASPWAAVPISETQVSEPTTQPPGSTSVGGTGATLIPPDRETAPAVSYGLRVLAAREEMVFAGLCGNEMYAYSRARSRRY